MDWAVHLEHLQTVLKKFDSVATFNKKILIWYFQEDFRPFI